MDKEKLSIFLSHSHKDIDKVRKIRDLLETLDCEPLIFYLKCLDDDNAQLEDFIKKEIERRSLFLYCKSENSEKSLWVQRELDYIRKFDKNRLYSVDIEGDFALNMVDFVSKLSQILRENRIFLSYSHENAETAHLLTLFFESRGYVVYAFEKMENPYDWSRDLKKVAKEGVFIYLLTPAYTETHYTKRELKFAVNEGATVLPIVIKESFASAEEREEFLRIYGIYGAFSSRYAEISAKPTEEQLDKLSELLMRLLLKDYEEEDY